MFIVYFGAPGSGKTSFAARLAFKHMKKGEKVYCNFPLAGTFLIDVSDIGRVDISDGVLLVDEAGIDFNNRSYKSLPKDSIKWFKLYRHYGITHIYVFSQSYDDMDITLRRLADRWCVIRRFFVPGLVWVRDICRSISIDKDTHQIADLYAWRGFPFRFFWLRPYWPMFDSWDAPKLPRDSFPVSPIPPKILKKLKKHRKGVLK